MISICILLRVNLPKIKNKKNYFFECFLLLKEKKKLKKVFCVFKIEKTWCYFAIIFVFWFEVPYVPICYLVGRHTVFTLNMDQRNLCPCTSYSIYSYSSCQ